MPKKDLLYQTNGLIYSQINACDPIGLAKKYLLNQAYAKIFLHVAMRFSKTLASLSAKS